MPHEDVVSPSLRNARADRRRFAFGWPSGPSHILHGGGYNTTFLNATSVHDDVAIDKLTGSAGSDWFFANLDVGVKDKITDQASGELLQEIS